MSGDKGTQELRVDIAEMIRRHDAERWTVDVVHSGALVIVRPVRGLGTIEGGSYPKSLRGIERAVRKWQRWCDRQNAKIDRAQALTEEWGDGSGIEGLA